MNEALLTAFIGVCGTALGYVLSLWRTRIVPWVTLTSFGDVKREADRVPLSKELGEATARSWFMESLTGDETYLQSLADSYATARIWLKLNEDSEDTLQHAIEKLSDEPTDQDTQEALREVLGPKGLSDVLEMGLQRQKITVVPNMEATPQLPMHIVDDDDGRFQFEFPDSLLMFGENIKKIPYIKTRLEPFAQMATRLEADKMRTVFEELVPYVKEQKDIHQSIVTEAQAIIDRQARWLVKLSVSNLGSGPIAVFPHGCSLKVTGRHIKPFDLGCHILSIHEEKWLPLEALTIIPSGQVVELAAATDATQGDIDGGDLLRDVYRSGKATGRLRLKCMGRDVPWKQTVLSTRLKFVGR